MSPSTSALLALPLFIWDAGGFVIRLSADVRLDEPRTTVSRLRTISSSRTTPKYTPRDSFHRHPSSRTDSARITGVISSETRRQQPILGIVGRRSGICLKTGNGHAPNSPSHTYYGGTNTLARARCCWATITPFGAEHQPDRLPYAPSAVRAGSAIAAAKRVRGASSHQRPLTITATIPSRGGSSGTVSHRWLDRGYFNFQRRRSTSTTAPQLIAPRGCVATLSARSTTSLPLRSPISASGTVASVIAQWINGGERRHAVKLFPTARAPAVSMITT